MEEKQNKKVVSRDAKTGKVGSRTHKPKNVKVRKKDFDELLLSLSSFDKSKK